MLLSFCLKDFKSLEVEAPSTKAAQPAQPAKPAQPAQPALPAPGNSGKVNLKSYLTFYVLFAHRLLYSKM